MGKKPGRRYRYREGGLSLRSGEGIQIRIHRGSKASEGPDLAAFHGNTEREDSLETGLISPALPGSARNADVHPAEYGDIVLYKASPFFVPLSPGRPRAHGSASFPPFKGLVRDNGLGRTVQLSLLTRFSGTRQNTGGASGSEGDLSGDGKESLQVGSRAESHHRIYGRAFRSFTIRTHIY